jgi:hypothetical protein
MGGKFRGSLNKISKLIKINKKRFQLKINQTENY